MKRSDRILAAAFRELDHWRNAPQLSVAEYNLRHVNDRAFRKSEADRNIVGCNPGQWLNEASTAGIRAANSRAYKELYAQGYAERVVSYLGFGNRRTVALYLTEAGQARAAELLSNLPPDGGILTLAAATSEAPTQNLMEKPMVSTLSRIESEVPSSWGPATTPLPMAKPTAAPATPVKHVSEGTVRPRPLATVVEGLSAERLAGEIGYGEGLAKWLTDDSHVKGLKAHVGDSPETLSLEMLRDRRDKVQGAELKLSQDCHGLTMEYLSHAEGRVPELATFVESCEEEFKATEESVIRGLNDSGVSVESQKAYPGDVKAATITFRHQVQGTAAWKGANAKFGKAREVHQAAVESVTAGRADVAKAQSALAATVKRLAGVC